VRVRTLNIRTLIHYKTNYPMKKHYLIVLAFLTTLCASCNSLPSPKENAIKYAQALGDYDIDAAMEYATEETQKITLLYYKNFLIPHLDTAYIAANTPATITYDSLSYLCDTQATVYYHKKTPIQTHIDANVEMRLRNGQWLAHQIISPSPFFSGKIGVADTAEMKRQRKMGNKITQRPHIAVPIQPAK